MIKMSNYTELFAPTSLTALIFFINMEGDIDNYNSVIEVQAATQTTLVLLVPTLRMRAHCNILDVKHEGRTSFYRPNKHSAFLSTFKTLLVDLENDLCTKPT